MQRTRIISDGQDSCKLARMSENLSVFFSNSNVILAERFIENLGNETRDSGRTVVIVPGPAVKNFLIKHIVDKRGLLFGIRFLTLPQAVQYFTKISVKKRVNFPNHVPLMLHIETEIRRLQHSLVKRYIAGNEDRIVSLAADLSHAFLYYGLYGGKALLRWEEKDGWQQQIWKRVTKVWDFPIKILSNDLLPPRIHHFVHLFDIDCVPELYKKFFDDLSLFFPTSHYFKSPTNLFWGDILSDFDLACLDEKFDENSATVKERGYFHDLIKEANPLLANMGRVGASTFVWLSEDKEYSEDYSTDFFSKGASTLSVCKSKIFQLDNEPIDEAVDDSIQIHEATSRHREVEILIHTLQKIFYENNDMVCNDVKVLVTDIEAYFPYICFLFNRDDSLFSYSISGLLSIRKDTTLQCVKQLFDIMDGRFEGVQILEFISALPIRSRARQLTDEDISLLREITTPSFSSSTTVSWGFDKKMRQRVLDQSDVSEEGTWKHCFHMITLQLAEPSSRIDLNMASNFGRIVEFVEGLHTDLMSMRDQVSTLQEWIQSIEMLLDKYFWRDDSIDSILLELMKLSFVSSFVDEKFTIVTIREVISEVLKGSSSAEINTDKPIIHFESFGEEVVDARVIYILGMDEDSFPRRKMVRSINQLQNEKDRDPYPSVPDRDRYIFLKSLISAQDYFILSFVGTSEEDGRKMFASPLVSELCHYVKSLNITEHPPFPFHKQNFLRQKHFSKQNYDLAKAHYGFSGKTQTTFTVGTDKQQNSTLEIDVKDLITLTNNPIKLFCNKAMKVYLDRERGFYDRETDEFMLSYLTKSLIRKKSLLEPLDNIIMNMKRTGRMPTSLFYLAAKYEIEDEVKQFKESLDQLNLTEKNFLNICFEPSCRKSMVLSREYNGLRIMATPQLVVEMPDGRVVKIRGHLDQVTDRGIFCYGKGDSCDLWKFLPHVILLANTGVDFPTEILFGKSGEKKSIILKDPQKTLISLIQYYEKAISKTSPLMPDKINKFMCDTGGTNRPFIDPYSEFIKPDFSYDWSKHVEDLCKILNA